ncbi:glycosyltransferase family 61 protein [Hymenobacter busanensis]|uniref:Glycosyltransferase family 61 protein n=1 Tax=Hymenobacter busanensis TaxID=2607656 RepID=A0A7L4ZVH9_9BACT|nr:glycosyltransferase family 61 protein [Hymenobacter busanensis]KAA9339265.1 glycosyltransferase family 61 protein [Hymenobacter busanensis]QHJ06973.1 DUF563 domain-containing protein [Hymenobacter busanensis]
MQTSHLLGTSKQLLKQAALTASGTVWRAPLSQSSSFEWLAPYTVYQHQSPPVPMPGQAAANGGPVAHPAETRVFEPECVWQVPAGGGAGTLSVCRSGGALVNRRRLLDVDFSASAGLLDSPVKLRRRRYPLVVAPWPHFWASYYDYITFVVAKLCRIEHVLGAGIWQEATVCYPLLHTPFEREFLARLGIPASAIVDTAPLWGTAIQADCLLLANSQQSWSSGAGDLALLRNRFRPAGEADTPGTRRIYLSRKGRRRVLNEAAVCQLLQAYGFDIIEDRPYPLAEQMQLFREAGVIVTPHGAALTNLLWCGAGTRVLEFFANGYTPNYYYYMCTALGFDYRYLVDYSLGEATDHWTNMAQDMTVDLQALEQQLALMLEPAPAALVLS